MHLYNLILAKKSGNYPLRTVKEIPAIKVKHRFFENSFFLAIITEWNDLDHSLRNAPSINVFKQNVLKFIRLGPNKVFNIYSPHGLKLLTRLRLGLYRLRGHNLIIISVIVLMKFVCVEAISNLRTISSSNVTYFLKKGKSS